MPRTVLALVNRLATAVILLTMAAGCEHTSEGSAGQAVAPVTGVEVVRPERHTVRRSVSEPGELQAFETATIHARIPGYVKGWNVNIGAAVKKGQVLAELSVPELEADVQQKRAAIAQAVAKQKLSGAAVRVAEANVQGAEAKLAQVRASVKRAEADLVFQQSQTRRISDLVSSHAVTESLLDEARSKLHSAESTLAEVQAQVKTAEVAVTQAHAAWDQARAHVGAADAAIEVAREEARRADALLGYTRITAPFDGIVTQRNVDTGDLIQPGAEPLPLFMIAKSDVLTICVAIPEVFAPAVNAGDRAQIKLQAVPGRTIEGKVTRVSWALDPKVRTLRAEIDIPNPDAKLQPGLYAYATIIAEEHPDVLTVPLTAIVSEQGKDYCVAVVDGKAVRKPVTRGLEDGLRAEIVSGLKGDESIVNAYASSLNEGQPVQIIQPATK
jgi:RND family efflux transporter MFP subunit